jgi:transcription initiation factor TFIIH subunit 1
MTRDLGDFPEALLLEMTGLQTATSEFLRQFWSAVHPPPPEQGVLSIATPTQLLDREEKMAGYLSQTEIKIEAILRTASTLGADPGKVQAVSLCFPRFVICLIGSGVRAHAQCS